MYLNIRKRKKKKDTKNKYLFSVNRPLIIITSSWYQKQNWLLSGLNIIIKIFYILFYIINNIDHWNMDLNISKYYLCHLLILFKIFSIIFTLHL